jgi:hypothetical protein
LKDKGNSVSNKPENTFKELVNFMKDISKEDQEDIGKDYLSETEDDEEKYFSDVNYDLEEEALSEEHYIIDENLSSSSDESTEGNQSSSLPNNFAAVGDKDLKNRAYSTHMESIQVHKVNIV